MLRLDGGIGRRAGLKHQCRKASRFEPESRYNINSVSSFTQRAYGIFFFLRISLRIGLAYAVESIFWVSRNLVGIGI